LNEAPTPNDEPAREPVSPWHIRWPRLLLFAFVVVVGYFVASQFDKPMYFFFRQYDSGDADWHRFLRIMGWAPTWMIAAVILALVDWGRVKVQGFWKAMWRPVLLLLAIACSGAVGEVLKLLIRRERPNANDGMYVWRAWTDETFRTGGLATPSSHAIVAFAAAFMMCKLVPQVRVVWILLAVGCAFSRVANHAHWVGDVYVSAVVAYGVVHLLWRLHLRNNPELPREPGLFDLK